ncbi:dynein axonemal intermediate chain 2-like, partial [Xylocopa sonorina]|uniref:dynein axonemal intermediate chain 2-like n=1 Tax=Xylocopa sonorina TaxID=1818115 RepID=UPI00403AA79A
AMEIKRVYVKTRAEFGKQCVFDQLGPLLNVDIAPHPAGMNDYIWRSHRHIGVQHSKQLALHEVQTEFKATKNSGMFHFEGGWPKEINPRDEETTARYRRRIEKDEDWAPKLRNLFEVMEQTVLQNGAMDIYQHYFDDMIATPLVQPLGLRTVNLYTDPETPKRTVTNISWTPDAGTRIAVCYCFLDYGRPLDYSKRAYIWQVENPNHPYMGLDPYSPCVACEFNPLDPSILASGLMTGQVCSWDIRTGNTPVQYSHLLLSHREFANAVKWVPTKSNTEFFSTSTDGRVMWWDTRHLRGPTEILMFDLEYPNEPHIDRAIGVTCLNFGPMVGTKFMVGLENGIIITGSRRMRTNAEKLANRFDAHYAQVFSVDRNNLNPSIFLSVGGWRARIWAEDTREGNLISTPYLRDYPTAGCWNKARYSVFYVTTGTGRLLVWDVLDSLRKPVFTLKLCDEKLTSIAPCEEGPPLLAIGNCVGEVYLVEPTDFFRTFSKKERAFFSEYLERCSKLTKAVDVRLREIKLTQKIMAKEERAVAAKAGVKSRLTRLSKSKKKKTSKGSESGTNKERMVQKEKKKIRDEDPDLVAAEMRYFEAVQKGLEAYEKQSDPKVHPSFQLQPGLKKVEKKRKSSRASVNDRAESRSKKDAGKIVEEKSSKTATKTKSVTRSSAELAHLLKELDDARTLTSRLDEDTDQTRKTLEPKSLFKLPVPCKRKVCRPRVCCWRTGKKARRKGRKSRVSKKAFMDHSTVSSRKPMDGSKSRSTTSRLVKEMLEPPTVLSEDVARAKMEIRTVGLLSERLRRKYTMEESAKHRKVQTRRTKPRRGFKVLEAPGAEEEEEREEDWRSEEDEIEEKRKVIPDPCSAPPGRNIKEQFSTIFGISTAELTRKKKKKPGKSYLGAYKRALQRDYPRISEFGQVE